MSGPRIAVAGATGFVGSAVMGALLDGGLGGPGAAPARVRVLGRRPGGYAGRPGVEWRYADLASPATLDGTCDGADVLLSLACSLSSDEARCAAVNVTGTAALMAEAVRAGVRHVVHLSTAAVYGPGPHHGVAVGGVRPAPVSPASRTRLAGERYALEAGATVLRLGLVTGTGDRWVVPALDELLARVPALWDGGRALLSVIDVGDLARLIVSLAAGAPAPGRRVLHASHPLPVRTGELLAGLARQGVLPHVSAELPWAECLLRLRERPGRTSERQFALLARDHWYVSDEVWRIAGCPPGPGPVSRLPRAAAFYRTLLRG
ncbi:nucleoside-diphosphate-sugar epimerase [Streptomyces sp. BK208]|uniref:NAD-dependent epimerase/dehydratase family protein n=1 Tax=Streptomyces sp. BK208 TaxID=2512150 RepID=UPI00106065C8|nr:NAD(P)-dependent oxidoreductase [Streptomyces sp. BK208]TDT23052.1 nucleoside-diphosphate-sugar epimerase [Streptomyces sp. BK208]